MARQKDPDSTRRRKPAAQRETPRPPVKSQAAPSAAEPAAPMEPAAAEPLLVAAAVEPEAKEPSPSKKDSSAETTEEKEGSELGPWFSKTRYAATVMLIGINIAVFIAMAIASQGDSISKPGSTLLIKWGALCGPYLYIEGEYWRLFSSLFVHSGVQHLLYNMVSLLAFGISTESLYGSKKFLLLYFLSGLGGAVSTVLWSPDTVCSGASGAICGLYGGFFGFILVRRKAVSKSTFHKFLRSIILLVIWYGLYEILSKIDKSVGGIAHAAHIGGFLSGVLLAWIYDPSRCQKLSFHPVIGTFGMLALEAAILFYATTIPFNPENYKSMCAFMRMTRDLQLHKWDAVVNDATILKDSKDHRAIGFRTLSRANIELNRPQLALQYADEGLRWSPEDDRLWEARDASLIALGQKEMCLEQIATALKQRKTDALFKRQGLVMLKTGDFAGAAKSLHTLIFTTRWWHNEKGLYEAMLAVVSYKLDGKDDPAKKILAEAVAMADHAWPYPILEFLDGRLTADELIAKAYDDSKMTEARAYIGLTFATYKTAHEQAIEHLQWVVDHGDPTCIEYDLAKSELALLAR